MSMADDALALVRERAEIRSSAIAELLGCTVENVHEMLRPAVEARELVACDVEAGGEKLKDYRVAVAAGGQARDIFYAGRPPAKPRVTTFAFGRGDVQEPRPRPAPTVAPKPSKEETPAMNQKDEMIVAALKARGPMNGAQLREQFKYLRVAKVMGALVKAGHVVTLDNQESVFGVKGQKLTDWKDLQDGVPAGADKPRKKPAPKKRAGAKRKKAGKKAGSAAARKAWKTRRAAAAAATQEAATPASAGAFRPAYASDGVLLLIGQEKPGELNRKEARSLTAFLRQLDEAGALA